MFAYSGVKSNDNCKDTLGMLNEKRPLRKFSLFLKIWYIIYSLVFNAFIYHSQFDKVQRAELTCHVIRKLLHLC